MRQLLLACFIGVVIIVTFALASFSDEKQFTGEIIGVHVNARLQDLQSGDVKKSEIRNLGTAY